MVEDGQGPRGTNRWLIPYSAGGDKISPLTICHPDKNTESLGDIPSGDIPSGDKMTPEFKEPEPYIFSILENNLRFYDWWEGLKVKLSGTTLKLENQIVTISGLGAEAAILQARYTSTINRALQISPDLEQIVFSE
jgi:hypothetical protein